MDRRQLVKATLAHQKTYRTPYCISFTPDGEQRLKELIGERSAKDFVDNDIVQVNAPWWQWHNLGPDWRQADIPASKATVLGNGSYKDFYEQIKMLRDNTDKYILVMIYREFISR